MPTTRGKGKTVERAPAPPQNTSEEDSDLTPFEYLLKLITTQRFKTQSFCWGKKFIQYGTDVKPVRVPPRLAGSSLPRTDFVTSKGDLFNVWIWGMTVSNAEGSRVLATGHVELGGRYGPVRLALLRNLIHITDNLEIESSPQTTIKDGTTVRNYVLLKCPPNAPKKLVHAFDNQRLFLEDIVQKDMEAANRPRDAVSTRTQLRHCYGADHSARRGGTPSSQRPHKTVTGISISKSSSIQPSRYAIAFNTSAQ